MFKNFSSTLKTPQSKILVTVILFLFVSVGIVGTLVANSSSHSTLADAVSSQGKDCATSLPRAELKPENGNVTAMTTIGGEKYLSLTDTSNNQNYIISSYKQSFEHKHWRWPVDGCSVYKAYYNVSNLPAGNYRTTLMDRFSQPIGNELNVAINTSNQPTYNYSRPNINNQVPQLQKAYYYNTAKPSANHSQLGSEIELGYYRNADDITLVNTPGIDTKSLQELSNSLSQWHSEGYPSCYNNDWSVGSCNYMKYLRDNKIIYTNNNGYWTLSQPMLDAHISKYEKLL